MTGGNPFTLTFGKQPNQLISRHEDMNKIIDAFGDDNPLYQSYLIEGVRGSGKTVLMTTIANALKEDSRWIIININSAMNLLEDFALRLKEAAETLPGIFERGFSISIAGFGVSLNTGNPVQDYVGVINKILKQIRKKKKRVLITIDEVLPNDNMRLFASQFQIFVREEYPVFLIMTGLYENIYKIQNDPSLTFLLRTPKIRLEPLSILQITRQYRDLFQIDEESAKELAHITRGYAFAFQAMGAIYWKFGKDWPMDRLLEQMDEMLDDYVYKKIWASLTERERDIVRVIRNDNTKAKNICDEISMRPGSYSKYREELVKKGILVSVGFGYVSLALPRFYEVVRHY